MHVLISKSIFSAVDPEKRSNQLRPLFVVVAVAVCACFMLIKGPEIMKIKPVGAAVGIGVCVGVFAALIVIAGKKF